MVQGILVATPRLDGTDTGRGSLILLGRDFNAMNEVLVGKTTEIQFVLDSYRRPGYSSAADADGDGVPNGQDPDLDGDALDFTAAGQVKLADSLRDPPTSRFWRTGFNLEDDDENNDGFRDILCKYRYDSAANTLTRSFKYDNAAWTSETVVLKNVTSFAFGYFGSIDFTLGVPAGGVDQNGDRRVDQDELADLDGVVGGPASDLVNFNETRYITGISLEFTVLPNPKINSPTRLKTDFAPPLLAIKRKYP